MRLIKKILSRKKEVDVPYIKKTFSLLKKSVKDIKESSLQLCNAEDFKKDRSVEVKTLRARLRGALKKLDLAVAMYFKIDEFTSNLTLEERQYLGELQKYWYNIKLDDLPATQWDIIISTIKKYNLNNVKILINMGSIELSSNLYNSAK